MQDPTLMTIERSIAHDQKFQNLSFKQIIKTLKENKVYPTRADNGMNPFHLACRNGSLDIVHYFVSEAGYNKDEPKDNDSGKATGLAIALARGHFEVATYLINKDASVSPYIFYVSCKVFQIQSQLKQHQNLAFHHLLLDKLREQGYSNDMITSAIVNGRFDNSKSTPLMRACQYGSVQTVKFLIDQLGAQTDLTNKNDENCLMIAVRYRQKEVVKFLCENVVRPNTPLEVDYECSRNGLTAFARALFQHDFDIADIILQQGKAFKGYVNKKEGKSILELAQKAKNQAAVNYINGAQGGAQKQTVVETKFDQKQFFEPPSQKSHPSKQNYQPQKRTDEDQGSSGISLKKELNPKPLSKNTSAITKLQEVVQNTREASPQNSRNGSQMIQDSENKDNSNSYGQDRTQENLLIENVTSVVQETTPVQSQRKEQKNGQQIHQQNFKSDNGPVTQKVQNIPSQVQMSMKQEANKYEDILESEEQHDGSDNVNLGNRPDSRDSLNQNAAQQNKMETMNKLKNLKDEYRKKYKYKNQLSAGTGIPPKKH
ncbi:ankyrin repeat domain-containing protein 50-like [Stylonychia lemnae]|uniref:Ankyrin repeat domain-containing protein 50-like n=1 Tax=Stylonychia lemnae TaxID=5949 RepID=A0A078A9Z5_STYLE|nr:ankyrin repeat domain-containing protein 50-like [Stylonychia lemnae]|eukprot:CDW79090.1 ankyrin repeat domain-containing protein 50-like [Stylonychia lemnae]